MKKLEWTKPILRDLGSVVTDGKQAAGSCKSGSVYWINEYCGVGQNAINTCNSGVGVGQICTTGTSFF